MRHSESNGEDGDITEPGALKAEIFRPAFEKFNVQKIFVGTHNCAHRTVDILNKVKTTPKENLSQNPNFKKIIKKNKSFSAIAIVTHDHDIKQFFKRKILEIDDLAYAEIVVEKNKFKVIKTDGIKFDN